MWKMQIVRNDCSKLRKDFKKYPSKHRDIFILKIWFTTDLKRNSFIVFKMTGVL